MRIPLICLVAAGALALGGCGYNGVGLGVGYGGYGNYGYNPYYGSYAGYGYGGRYGGYGGYGGLGYGGYGYQPFGWYDGFYYPGTGYYVYDNYRRPRIWSDAQRAYWVNRIRTRPTSTTTTTVVTPSAPNWSGFERRNVNRGLRQERIQSNRAERLGRLEQRRIERQRATSNTTTRSRETRRSRRDD